MPPVSLDEPVVGEARWRWKLLKVEVHVGRHIAYSVSIHVYLCVYIYILYDYLCYIHVAFGVDIYIYILTHRCARTHHVVQQQVWVQAGGISWHCGVLGCNEPPRKISRCVIYTLYILYLHGYGWKRAYGATDVWVAAEFPPILSYPILALTHIW